jgi:hypothetical protein
MPFDFIRPEGQDFAVGRGWGLVREADIHASIDFAFARRTLYPGVDRMAIIDTTARLHELDIAVLVRVRDRILAHELMELEEPRHRMALVIPNPVHAGIGQLYKALWDTLGYPEVRLEVAGGKGRAMAFLGRPRATPVPVPPSGHVI